MLDQSFSAKSFQEIFDLENRKGNNLENRFKEDFSESREILKELKQSWEDLREARSEELKITIKERIRELKDNRKDEIKKVFELQEEKIKEHQINLELGGDFGGQCYKLEENLLNFFISKKIQYNINRNYKVKQASRHNILSAFVNLIEDEFPKYVIRTDIKSFYESVPQEHILEKIKNDHLLSISSIKYIQRIFHEYNRLTNQSEENAIGLPRGIGISAYLSELFMRDIDNQIKNLDDLVYYARYVDDIVAVFIPKTIDVEKKWLAKYYIKIKNVVTEKGIKLNQKKTNCFDLTKNISSLILRKETFKDGHMMSQELTPNDGIEFLGYQIGFLTETKIKSVQKIKKGKIQNTEEKSNTHQFSVQLSENRTDKYLKRINSAFAHFTKKKEYNRKYVFKLLEARIRYLTSNTKLKNSKSRIFVGVYYSNPFLNDDYSLQRLDTRLNWKIARSGLSQMEKDKLKRHSFKSGFQKRTFQVLPLKNKTYKNHNNKSQTKNKGVLQFGITEITSIWKNEK